MCHSINQMMKLGANCIYAPDRFEGIRMMKRNANKIFSIDGFDGFKAEADKLIRYSHRSSPPRTRLAN